MASGSFNLTRTSGSEYVLFWIEYSSTSDVATNTSTVTATMKARRTNTGYTTSGTGTFKININGQETSVSKTYSITSNEVTIMTATQSVQHNNDGTKTITMSGQYSGDSPIGGNGSESVTLDTIARASDFTLSSSNVTMGNNLVITINRASSNFIHQVFYSFGSLSWQGLSSSATTSYTWAVPISLTSQVPNATSGTATIIVETYDGQVDSSHYIGAIAKTLKLTVPSSVVPTISSVAIAEAVSGLANQFGVYVQNKSKLSTTITAAGAYGSTITRYSANLNGNIYSGNTFTTSLLSESGNNTMVVTVTDSRGRTATYNKTFNVTAYSDPNIETFAVARDDTTPSTVVATIKASIANVNNRNTYSYIIKYKKSSQSYYSSKTVTGTTSVDTTVNITNIDENSTYNFRLEVKDYFTTITSIKSLSTAFTLMDFNVSGKGMAIGKVSESNSLELGISTNAYRDINIITDSSEIRKLRVRNSDSSKYSDLNYQQLSFTSNNGSTSVGAFGYPNAQLTNTTSDKQITMLAPNSGDAEIRLGSTSSINTNIKSDGSIECKSLKIDNVNVYGEKTIYSTQTAINSASNITLTNMPNLTEYTGKTVNIYVKYNNDQAKKYSFVVGNNSLWIEYTRNFNGADIWHTLFEIENITSTSWKISTIKSYTINTAITNIAITTSNYMFYIDKITIN